jgi:hypothetical protein
MLREFCCAARPILRSVRARPVPGHYNNTGDYNTQQQKSGELVNEQFQMIRDHRLEEQMSDGQDDGKYQEQPFEQHESDHINSQIEANPAA